LHLGGVGLARGYLNKPALTQERCEHQIMIKDTNIVMYIYSYDIDTR
jgi:non-ribosomal peptide synthetase component F